MLKSHSLKVVDLRIDEEFVAVGIWNSIWALLANDRTINLLQRANLMEWLCPRQVGDVAND